MKKNICFLATTNKLDIIDASLRRPGRFEKEVEIPIPNVRAREDVNLEEYKNHKSLLKQSFFDQILKKLLVGLKCNLSEKEVNEVAQNCHGYVGADLKMLVNEASMCCVKRIITTSSHENQMTISLPDFFAALHKVKPSAMRAISFDIPKVYWSDIGGQKDLKKKLKQAIIWPIKYTDSFKRLGIKAPRGILMYGPPGCSKTMIAKALATETGLNFIAVKVKYHLVNKTYSLLKIFL